MTGVMPVLSALKPNPTGPTRVALVQKASGPSDGYYSGNLPLPAVDVQADDLLWLMVLGSRGTIPLSPPVTDSDANTWGTDYNNTIAGTRIEGRLYSTRAAHDVTGLVVTLMQSSSSIYGEFVLGVYRAPAGKTWVFDSANMSGTNTFGSSPQSATFNTSGPGVTLIGLGSGNADGGATKGQHGIATGMDIALECPANATAGFGYFSFMGDILSDVALSSRVVTGNIYNTNPSGDTNLNKTLFVFPYTYS